MWQFDILSYKTASQVQPLLLHCGRRIFVAASSSADHCGANSHAFLPAAEHAGLKVALSLFSSGQQVLLLLYDNRSHIREFRMKI